MTIAMVPHRFTTDQNADMERLNDNLEAGARDVGRNLDRRYTYSSLSFPVDGVADTDATALRSLNLRRPGTNNAVEVFAVEMYLYASGTAVWTLSCPDDTTWPTIAVTAAGATVEATAISNHPISIPSSSSDIAFRLTGSSASTITAGRIILHLRCDRGNQGSAHTYYAPTLLDSSSSTSGALLDTELTALAAAVTADTNNNKDLRATLFAGRNLATGTSISLRVPSGAVRIMGVSAYLVGAVGATATFAEAVSNNQVANLAGIGAASRAFGSSSTVFSFTDDPMTPASDAFISITASGTQTSLLAYMILWWS